MGIALTDCITMDAVPADFDLYFANSYPCGVQSMCMDSQII
ncbi:hypothetical protein [Pseudomonas triclosanedens]